MKLNKIASALAFASLALSTSAAWSDTFNAPNPSVGVTATTSTGGTITVTGSNTLVNPALTTTGAGTDVLINNGSQTLAPVQGTIGGPGGPSGAATSVNTALGGGTGLLGTPHDFASGTGTLGASVGTVGLCTFCHTPHKAASTLLLWNHTLSSNTFAWDVAATTAGTALPGFVGNTYKGPSAKCLSCHDGSVAVGDVGWFNMAPKNGTGALNTFMIGSAKTSNDSTSQTDMLVGASGSLTGTHPVAIPYPLNGAPNVYNGSTTGAQLATNDFVTDPTANNMRLYSDVGGGNIVGKVQPGKTGIECSSCHDPHNKASKDNYFLRGYVTGSTQASGYICLQCHIK